jgi:serine/threonine-protein kinase
MLYGETVMKKETTLCMGCMADNKDEFGDKLNTCAVCGYTGNSVFLSSYLAPETFLADRYIIGKLISYNGEGALYIAYDTAASVKVTVREYMPDTLCGRKKEEEAIEVNPQYVALYKTYLSEFVELNRSLMNAGQSLRVQKVLNVFNENNTAYVVYEYITGISLKSYLSNLGGVLPWEQVKELFTPLFTTLNLLHTKGIIHRGISPSTILLNDKSELVLINFGITASRTYASEINYEVFAGYAAPEQYSGAARHGSWTDVYGVAAVLYKVLTGQMPPNAVSRREDEGLRTPTEPMLINRNVPPSVSGAIMSGLLLDTEERTQEIGEFIDGLFETSPVSVPDSTNEILIKKPPRIAEAEASRSARSHQSRKTKDKKKTTSNAAAIAVCVMLGLVLVVFVVMMIYGDEIYNRIMNNDDEAPPAPVVTTTDNNSTPPPAQNGDTDDPPRDTQPNELFVVSDFTSRSLERTQNSNSFMFLSFIPEYEFNYDVPVGTIFEQDIPPGTEVADGTEITVKVSKGPSTIPLPDYAGMTFTEYMNLLFSLGVKYDSAPPEFHEEVARDYIIRCSINVGDIVSIAEGDTVTVVYSRGPDPALAVIEMPDDDDDDDNNDDGDDDDEHDDGDGGNDDDEA